MKQRLILLLKTFGLLILFFVLMKPAFMLYHRDLYAGVGLADYFRVVWHGLPMDASVAGYFTALPALLLFGSARGCGQIACGAAGRW